tara:strand:- start:532 stop:714 length:183 start_codon:yes stop_codon:yes gene_type:complete
MKPYNEFKAEMEAIQHQMIEVNKNECANSHKEVKCLPKEFGFTSGVLKRYLDEGGNKKCK